MFQHPASGLWTCLFLCWKRRSVRSSGWETARLFITILSDLPVSVFPTAWTHTLELYEKRFLEKKCKQTLLPLRAVTSFSPDRNWENVQLYLLLEPNSCPKFGNFNLLVLQYLSDMKDLYISKLVILGFRQFGSNCGHKFLSSVNVTWLTWIYQMPSTLFCLIFAAVSAFCSALWVYWHTDRCTNTLCYDAPGVAISRKRKNNNAGMCLRWHRCAGWSDL